MPHTKQVAQTCTQQKVNPIMDAECPGRWVGKNTSHQHKQEVVLPMQRVLCKHANTNDKEKKTLDKIVYTKQLNKKRKIVCGNKPPEGFVTCIKTSGLREEKSGEARAET